MGGDRGPPSRREVLLAALVVLALGLWIFACDRVNATAVALIVIAVMRAVGADIPGLPMREYAPLPCFTLGVMGIIIPYATGPSPVYYGSGFLPARDYWRPGANFGAIFLAVLLAAGVPWLLAIR